MTHSTIAERILNLEPSPTTALSAKANALKAEGRPVINLTVGEPNFETPDFIKLATIQALLAGDTKYTAVEGTKGLKEAIQGKLARENQLHYATNEIIASNGLKQTIYNLCQVLLEDGDEAIVPAPYWVSYPAMIQLAGARAVTPVATITENYKIHPDQLKEAITDKTKLFFINSPNNPSGMAYHENELRAFAEILLKHPKVFICTDDIYEHVQWRGAFKNILNVCPELRNRTIVCNGVSKSYAMTGFRIGYAAGPKEIVDAMANLQSQSTSGPCSISQAAACVALNGGLDSVFPMTKAYEKRHAYVYEQLKSLPGLKLIPVDGTFYTFIDANAWIAEHDEIQNDVQLAEFWLEKINIAIVPGSAFGLPGCFRLSFATDMANLEEACRRIRKVFL